MRIQEKSYDKHKHYFGEIKEAQNETFQTWFETDTVDHWRHHRMYAPIIPLLNCYPNAKWVTVGDGRYGLDSVRLKELQPTIDILPTDISPYLLEEALKKGIINRFQIENAEEMSFADEEFDFVFCKESYHHFPRPYMALYEFIRISKMGIILIEPNDAKMNPTPPERIIKYTKDTFKKIRGKEVKHPDTNSFEVIGNYVYTLSQREIEKTAISLQLPLFAIKYLNDHYEEGVEFEKMTETSPLFKKLKKRIHRSNVLCEMGIKSYALIAVILFKQIPDRHVLTALKNEGFDFTYTPENPYL